MMTTMMTIREQNISRAASRIAGAVYDDASGPVEERIKLAMNWKNKGGDGDLTSEDRDALGLLLDVLTGTKADLYDSDTTRTIREATDDEAIESALARPEGHILVDGRRCYVAL